MLFSLCELRRCCEYEQQDADHVPQTIPVFPSTVLQNAAAVFPLPETFQALQFVRALPYPISTHKTNPMCRKKVPVHSFLKIQQPNKVSTFEDAELVRDSVYTISDVCVSKLDVFFSRAIAAAENKHCNIFTSPYKRKPYRFCCVGAHVHHCVKIRKDQFFICPAYSSQCVYRALL